jgi:hypothetical protein
MNTAVDYSSVWKAVSALEYRSLQDWRTKHYPALELEAALATRVKVVETTAARRRGGSILVTVSVLAEKVSDCNVDTFHLQRTGNRIKEQVETSSPST